MKTLRNCLYCKSKAKMSKDLEVDYGWSDILWYFIECINDNCGIQTPQFRRSKDAIEVWNSK